VDGYGITWSLARQWNFLKRLRRLKDACLYRRCLIVQHTLGGAGPSAVARMVRCARSTVYQVLGRFAALGEAGLLDGRRDNGSAKVDAAFLAGLRELVRQTPPDFGWRRPTWTRELLIEQMVRQTGVRVSPSTMSRALRALGARRGRPRPVVKCPWSKWRRTRRVRAIRRLLARLPPEEVAVWEDEADIDLNPKIGYDWMLRGCQKEVVTPGQNVKRYVAGALEARTGRLIWVFGRRKDSRFFTALLWRLREVYAWARVIHVILDNAQVHASRHTRQTLGAMGGRVVLHFLPPYCPNDNRIERVWKDLHDNVTRNHQCQTMPELMRGVYYYLYRRCRRVASRLYKTHATPHRGAA
jgi:transposase